MLIYSKLLSKFSVIKVNYKFNEIESYWKISYNGGDVIILPEQGGLTEVSDEDIKEIIAQVGMDDDEIEIPTQHKKFYSNNHGELIITGIYSEDYLPGDEVYNGVIIDSVFPVMVDRDPIKNPMPVKKGEWVTVKGLPYLYLPRGINLK